MVWGDMDVFGYVNNVMYYCYVESVCLVYIEYMGILFVDVLIVVVLN